MNASLARLATAMVILAFLAYMSGLAVVNAQKTTTITIGVLAPLTGDLSDYGKRGAAALEVAVDDVNAYLEQKNAWFRLDLRIEDTGTNPDQAVQKVNTLISAGVKFMIGAWTSAELTKIKDIIDQNNVLFISPGSSAVALAIPGDNVYRFCTDDSVQSKAIVRIVRDLGIKAAVIIARADTWGQGLKKGITALYDQAGIEYKAYEYNPESPNFAALAAQAAQDVQAYINKYGADKVAVNLLAMMEGANFLHHATNYDALKKVLWFGADGTARLAVIVEDITAATFAQETLFLNTLYAPAATENQKIVDEKVYAKVKDHADAYAFAAYDAVWAIALSLLDANPNGTPDDWVNHVKAKLNAGITNTPEFAAHSTTGAFPLNAAGDRGTADYDLWLPVIGKWVLAGKYYGNQDRVEWFQLPEAGGKTYLDLVKARFQAAPATPTPTATAPTATQTTTTPAPAGLSTGTVVAIVIIIIVVAAAAFMLTRRK